jgi:hypothetical protein
VQRTSLALRAPEIDLNVTGGFVAERPSTEAPRSPCSRPQSARAFKSMNVQSLQRRVADALRVQGTMSFGECIMRGEANVYYAEFELPAAIAQQFRALSPLSTPVQELTASTAKVFSLGNILPGDDDDVVVHAWSASPPNDDLAKKITLTHDVGVGRVKLLR